MAPRKPKPGKSFADLRPEEAEEWHPTLNGDLAAPDVSVGSDYKAWWLCKTCRCAWEQYVYNRKNGSGCPACSGRRVVPGFNDLATKNPGVASEWHPTLNGKLMPTMVTEFSMKRVWWKCKEHGHEWESTIANRTSGGTHCPYCSGNRVLVGFNDLKTHHPRIAAEWHPFKNGTLLPNQVTTTSGKMVWWKCKEHGHEWQTRVAARTFMGSNCPFCAGRRVLPGFNDLYTLAPTVAEEWHPTLNGNLKPSETAKQSSRAVWWLCRHCAHAWKAKVCDRVSKGSGCPECYNAAASRIEASIREWFVRSPVLGDVGSAGNARVHIPWRKRKHMNVDVLGQLHGEDTPVVIEYDGSYWHSQPDKFEVDAQKTRALLDKGYLVVRIRSDDLAFLDITHESLLQVGGTADGLVDPGVYAARATALW